ncbi:hypothetical protein SERLADRAFT_404828 [Serpula lacrymans var. lacrymans S7.9]|uniref:Uncharacterized protein n=1 Tax=Serpula lacrymans var. lacrymans (strain S7.9) TaxID=578457 RepID=F8NFE8_SERL9|nr:uncharacterized protein SERLADRAFT_404828 [Serpula lacrymans var. lacrymans S7.9]EGO30827.1 hypothetical protein SERLADRAFT_404828 [Serpula lacrymans var. lacrymans S7.9]
MSNALMRREMLGKEFWVHFVSLSPHAAPMELIKGVTDSIRTCKVGGTQAQKKTDKGYQNIFRCQEAQTPQEMQAQILQQLDYSLESSETEKVKVAGTNSGICDSNTASIIQHLLVLGKQLRKYNSVKTDIPETEVRLQLEWELESLLDDSTIEDHINPLLGMPGVNIHQDNPTKVLHTVGVVKYFWAQKDGLIGKHFKSLAQVMPYLIYDLVLQDVLNGWCVIGNLVVLLRHTKIDNAEVYLAFNRPKELSSTLMYH